MIQYNSIYYFLFLQLKMTGNHSIFIGVLKKKVANLQSQFYTLSLSTINRHMPLDFSIRFIPFWSDNMIHRHGQGGLNWRFHLIQHRFGDGICILWFVALLICCTCCTWQPCPRISWAVAITLKPCAIISISLYKRFNPISLNTTMKLTHANAKHWKRISRRKFKRQF